MVTCPKCFKPNPEDAAFCGYCGAGGTPPKAQKAPATPSKTVYGYQVELPDANAPVEGRAPAQPPAASAAAPAAVTPQAAPAAPARPAPAIPQTHAIPAKQAIQSTPAPTASTRGPIGGRFLPKGQGHRVPVGELLVAEDSQGGAEASLLLVDGSAFPSPLDMERARRELRQLQKVECASIVKILDHGKAEDGRLYVAMEPVAGESLDVVVSRGAFDLTAAQEVIKGVGLALAEAQKMGVIHRDIAPLNILVGKNGAVRVRGFGVAPLIKKQIFGTPEFLSPEQAAGRPVDQRSNIYSLGALMFYMLVGEPPFSGADEDEILIKHQREELTSIASKHPGLKLPPRAEALIIKALAKSSSRRHLTLRQFLREVESLGGEANLSASQELPSPVAAQRIDAAPPVAAPKPVAAPPKPVAASPTAAPSPVAKTPSRPVAAQGATPIAPTLLEKPKPSPEPPPAVPRTAPAIPVQGAIPSSLAPVQAVPLAQPKPTPAAAPTAAQPAAAPVPRPTAAAVPVAAAAKPIVTASVATTSGGERRGEIRTEISLKQPEPAPEPAPGAKPEAAPVSATSTRQAGGGKGFRETLWFYKGEVESAMAAEGGEPQATAAPTENPGDLTAKYADDGSLSDEEAKRLSLRTGKTQAMVKVEVPTGVIPGEKMAAEDFVREMNRGKRIAIWVGLFVFLAVVGGVIAFLMIK
jgi:eukaryotic-like serine/threonine-protein kinase